MKQKEREREREREREEREERESKMRKDTLSPTHALAHTHPATPFRVIPS
jgi:hypothetical protein